VTRLTASTATGETLDEQIQCSVCASFGLAEAFRDKDHEYLKCRRCGLIFRKRITPAEEKATWETDTYDVVEGRHHLEFREAVLAESLHEIARTKKPGRLLDVGCGKGLFLNLARNSGWETYGVELSPVACRHAQEVHGLNVIRGELPHVHFADDCFDVVTLYDVLCHLPRPLDQLIEIHRILKTGGLLVLRVRNALFHVTLSKFARALQPFLVAHLYCFTPKTIRYVLEKAGYSDIRVRNSRLTSSDPYSVSPLWGERGMHVIKTGLHACLEAVSLLSGHTQLLGPSLMVHAVKKERGPAEVSGTAARGRFDQPRVPYGR